MKTSLGDDHASSN